ncbi:hypothetical protein AMTRI_Chr07g79840 [Amborella trichopoda]|uniref:Uncharacterized protein n=1 Tax=Amborella trichopoda TaxID=13333 RepID=W1PAU4_AMBTC|nr:uncharacterized protein LOC110007150 [Amborella trichopoda]ERN04809.1 hypothetical protein AMTR_s00140p00114520 [Amborella trichopoda]|eukprot:XP_020522130.1 uncharacterized protein LOC110007150 [Amborella trichopoda]
MAFEAASSSEREEGEGRSEIREVASGTENNKKGQEWDGTTEITEVKESLENHLPAYDHATNLMWRMEEEGAGKRKEEEGGQGTSEITEQVGSEVTWKYLPKNENWLGVGTMKDHQTAAVVFYRVNQNKVEEVERECGGERELWLQENAGLFSPKSIRNRMIGKRPKRQ